MIFVKKITLLALLSLSACSIPESTSTTTTTDPNVENCSTMVGIWNDYLFTTNWIVDVWNENVNGVRDSTSLLLELGEIQDKFLNLDIQLDSLESKLAPNSQLAEPILRMKEITEDPTTFISQYLNPEIKNIRNGFRSHRETTLALVEDVC
ncbi:MAG: hypothetical protein F2612_02340 [Actinobacteria bacterium]|uniref:Unannotated protein n=1 Tax=freshwater metagenome TaxID=449393 RepID=A0A6J6J8W7_9ZZZZ|nr:hypothetical protein [Actinomycetota bacterium]MSZ31758.1 hypothetical protein [Actinomycetota bacterium]